MRALVTGGAGFIGSHLADALTERSDQVLVVDNLSTGSKENLSGAIDAGARLEVADVVDRDAMIEIARSFNPDLVLHLAAQMDVRKSIDDPGFDATVNIAGTANMLEATRLGGAGRFVLASTGGAIYGEGDGRPLPLGEDEPSLPLAPYGQSKLAAEGYVSLYGRLYGVDGTSLRLGNVYGPRQDPFGEAGVIAIFCGKLLADERPRVYGSGRQTRDYIYVGDVVRAFLAAGSTSAPGPINIGTGQETSVLELVALLAARSGRPDLKPELSEARKGEVERISINPSLAARELAWQSEIELEEGLRVTLESFTGETV